MDWIDKLNKELEERRERNKTLEAKQEAIDRVRKWAASTAGKQSAIKNNGKYLVEYSKKNPNTMSIGGKKGGRKNAESGHLDRLHKQYAKENAKYFDHTEKICPNCNKTIAGLGMYSRWHGDNCKELKKIQQQLSIIEDLPEIFTSNDVVQICKDKNFNNKLIKYGLCKNPKYIEVIKVGTNQSNPSIFKKIYK